MGEVFCCREVVASARKIGGVGVSEPLCFLPEIGACRELQGSRLRGLFDDLHMPAQVSRDPFLKVSEAAAGGAVHLGVRYGGRQAQQAGEDHQGGQDTHGARLPEIAGSASRVSAAAEQHRSASCCGRRRSPSKHQPLAASLTGTSPIGLIMLAASRSAALHHREALAVLTSSSLFLAVATALSALAG